MMGYNKGQMEMIIINHEEMIPNEHLLKRIDKTISFEFIYEIMSPYYSKLGRPSIDPVSVIKMLLIGYLYGIKSERRLIEEIRLNIAYRWFCGFGMASSIPDHSMFSQNRKRKWNDSNIFENIFFELVKQCVEFDLVDGEEVVADGSFIPANVSRDSWVDVEENVAKSMHSYLDALDDELSAQPGFKRPPDRIVKKRRTTSATDTESGYIHQGSKRGIGYLVECTVDCKHGIVTGVDVSCKRKRKPDHP